MNVTYANVGLVEPVRGNRATGLATLTAALLTLAACSTLSPAHRELAWLDLRGDRGSGVSGRDLEECVTLAETRRSTVQSCMMNKGWAAAD